MKDHRGVSSIVFFPRGDYHVPLPGPQTVGTPRVSVMDTPGGAVGCWSPQGPAWHAEGPQASLWCVAAPPLASLAQSLHSALS